MARRKKIAGVASTTKPTKLDAAHDAKRKLAAIIGDDMIATAERLVAENLIANGAATSECKHTSTLSVSHTEQTYQLSARIWFSTSAGKRKRRPSVLGRSASADERRVLAEIGTGAAEEAGRQHPWEAT